MNPQYTIRFCTPADTEAVSKIIKTTFLDFDEFGEWAHMIMDGTHPTACPADTVVAVENASGEIVSAVPCVRQMFSYSGIPLPVMNMQIVGTLPEHREKGLLRAQVDAILKHAKQAGIQAVVVFGIAGFYRKLGFLPLLPYTGGRVYAAAHLKRRFPAKENETVSLRPVERCDLPFLARLHQCSTRRYLISFPYDQAYWKLVTFDYFERNRDQIRLITGAAGARLGTVSHVRGGGEEFAAFNLELMPGVSYLETLPPVLRALCSIGEEYARSKENPTALESLYLALGPSHPAYAFLEDVPQRSMPNTMGYIRLVDLPGFLRHIAPVLEERIANSPVCGYSRQVKIELYYRKEGLVLHFEKGRLADVCSQEIEGYKLLCDRADIEMPEQDFVRLLMGQVSVDELALNFREVNTWNGQEGLAPEFKILLRTLFPKQESFIYPCL